MTEEQKKEIMRLVSKMLQSFNLPRKEYVERVEGIRDWLYGKDKKEKET